MGILVKFLICFYLLYLWKYFSHRNIQYPKLILRNYCFDHLMSNFTLGVMVFTSEIKMSINFFLKKKLQKCIFWENNFIIFFIISLKVFELQRCTISQINPFEALFWPSKVYLCSRSCGFCSRDKNMCPLFYGTPSNQGVQDF